MQQWMTGETTTSLLLDTYRVDANYGDGLSLVWMAGLNGTWAYKVHYDAMHAIYHITYVGNNTWTSTYTLRDPATNAALASWSETQFTPHSEDYSYDSRDYMPDTYFNTTMNMTINFILPTFLTMQVFRTPTDDTVAWANMFNQMLIYNDTNHDGTYTVAPKSSGFTAGAAPDLSLQTSDEFVGVIMPEVVQGKMGMASGTLSYEYDMSFPGDGSVQDYLDQVHFTAPSFADDNTATWGIEYDGFPTMAYVSDGGQYNPCPGAPASTMSPADYKYNFSYAVDPAANAANFYTTVDIPRVTNSTLLNDVQGHSLSIPQSTYFLASSKIDKKTNDATSHPMEEFGFNIGDTPIAEISMSVASKLGYTLEDYPTTGQTQTYNTTGGTVMAVMADAMKNPSDSLGQNPFMSMIFALDELDIVKTNPNLVNNVSLFVLTTQNYPVWSGCHLVSDPVFTVFFVTNVSQSWIMWAVIGAVAVGIVVTIAVVIKKRRS